VPRNTSGLRRGGGRPKGVPNKATREIAAFARNLLESPEYLVSLRKRLVRGSAPHMETLLHHYGYGKPKDVLEVAQPRPLIVELIADAEARDTEAR
jgi:hypothetical protein